MFGAPRAMIKTIQDKMLKSNVNVIARARSTASGTFYFSGKFCNAFREPRGLIVRCR